MTSVSNFGRHEDDENSFDKIFWQRLSKEYRHLRRNMNTTDFIFDIDGIRRDTMEEGLGIEGYDQSFIEQRLREMERDRLIKLIPENKQFRLTRNGIERCDRLPVTIG